MEWLKGKRVNNHMTQSQVAEKCLISRSYYTHIENGTKTPSVTIAKNLGEILDFQWTYFFKEQCSIKKQYI